MSDRVPAPLDAVPDTFLGDLRVPLIAQSFARLLGRPLLAARSTDDASGGALVAALWEAPLAIVAHGTEADPLFFFGNRAALARFESTVEQFVGMPSRLSAEAPLRDERQTLLERVTRHGFIDDYAGIRISARGTRFPIRDAVVWNLLDSAGKRHGQAAAFAV